MRFDRRQFTLAGAAFAASTLLTLSQRSAHAATVGDNGLHTQPFITETFLDLAEDLADAQAQGKGLVVMFEQRGCPYCKEMHEVNFASQKVRDAILPHFSFVQLDLWGSREATDFDGKAMEEKELAKRWGVNFTPTLSFFAKDTQVTGSESGRMIESARIMGYLRPFSFMTMFQFVAEGHHKDENFQRFLQDKSDELKAAGQSTKSW